MIRRTCEVIALYDGLYFCAQAGFSHILVEGDAKNVFAALNAIEEDFSIDGGLVDEAKGPRLTAYELVHDNIPTTLIADSNLEGDSTGNKIGTYTLDYI
ncbi:hypothetical protein ACLB2K_035595 [Fragaria x ananassa]